MMGEMSSIESILHHGTRGLASGLCLSRARHSAFTDISLVCGLIHHNAFHTRLKGWTTREAHSGEYIQSWFSLSTDISTGYQEMGALCRASTYPPHGDRFQKRHFVAQCHSVFQSRKQHKGQLHFAGRRQRYHLYFTW